MLQKFFILCSGADSSILNECSEGERNKYAGIGATVFFTAVMAFISSSYALFTVFDNSYTAVFFGFIWGLLIFNIDRFIVATIKKRDNFNAELIQATPRLILAVIIAIVISKPLELKIFEKEVNQILLEQKNELTLANKEQIALQYKPKIESLKSNILNLKAEIATKEIEINNLYNTYISEAEGTAGTKLLGKGPVYKEKREKHDTALAALKILKEENSKKIRLFENEITELNKLYDKSVVQSQPIIEAFDGLMARITALNKLPWLPSLFIFLLFLAIETTPIIAKLLAPKGIYDIKLEEAESIVKTWASQKIKQRQLLIDTDEILNTKIYTEIASEDEIYTYKKKKAIALLKLQADAFQDIQTKNL